MQKETLADQRDQKHVALTPQERAERTILATPLSAGAFAQFGQVLDASGAPDRLINRGRCGLYADRAQLDFRDNLPSVSLLLAEPRDLPYQLNMVERCQSGTQTYIPMNSDPFLVMVAPDAGDRPGRPVAFVSNGKQAVNYTPGTWRSVLTPLVGPDLFARIEPRAETGNSDEYWFEKPYYVTCARVA